MKNQLIKYLIFGLIVIVSNLIPIQFCFSQWNQTNGFEGGSMSYFAVSGNKIMGISDQYYFCYSCDSGNNWKDVTNNLPNFSYQSITNVGNDFFTCGYGGGIFRTTNNGDNWFSVNNGLSDLYAFQITSSNNLLIAGVSNKMYSSTDQGSSWQIISDGFSFSQVQSLSTCGNNIFAGMYNGLFSSTNNGLNWINCGLGNAWVQRLSSFGNTIIAPLHESLFYSTNAGLNWSIILSAGNNIVSILNKGNLIFACANNVMYRSTNSGGNWTTYPQYYACMNYTSNRIIAGDGTGISISDDIGVNWNQSNSGYHHQKVPTLYSWNDTIYAYSNSLYKSGDNGNTWNEIGNISNLSIISFIAKGNYLFAGTFGHSLYRSSDRGLTWTQFNSGLASSNISCFEIIGDTIYAGSDGSSRISKSTNNGDSWFSSTSFQSIPRMFCLKKLNNELYAGTSDGIYKSINYGLNWQLIINGLTNSYVKCLTISNNNLYAGTYNGVFISTNNGLNWNATSQINGFTNLHIYSLIADGNYILAGTGSGLYGTTDQGQHWAGKNEGFHFQNENLNTTFNCMVRTSNYLIASVGDNSLWKRFYNELTDINNNSNQNPDKYYLSQNYPNPFNPTTKINFSIPFKSFVSLKVYNIMGEEVENIVNQNLNAGLYEFEFKAENLSSGIYFYKLEVDKFSETKKMILIK